ncbi:MAG TPA: pantoate--beta-alanine ligase, partial [Roseimicrobium sp.]|nr:pantoate--beta-alanine ligase [Roseimicrobium sp.]
QQLRVLTAMVEALDFPIQIVPGPTVREEGGLAMSSRNRYLTPAERHRALAISAALGLAEAEVKKGNKDASRLLESMRGLLLEQQMAVDYVAAIDPRTLVPRTVIDAPTTFAIAARVGTTRLIDNLLVAP